MKPPKEAQLLATVRQCIEIGRYLDSRHAFERQQKRRISRPEILYVLLNGHHEKRKDRFDDLYGAWNYAIRGKTVDQRDLRIIVSFDRTGMLIITAIEIRR